MAKLSDAMRGHFLSTSDRFPADDALSGNVNRMRARCRTLMTIAVFMQHASDDQMMQLVERFDAKMAKTMNEVRRECETIAEEEVVGS